MEHRPDQLSGPFGFLVMRSTAAVNVGDWVCLKGRSSGVDTRVIHKIRMRICDWGTKQGDVESEELVAIHTGDDRVVLEKVEILERGL